FFESGGDSILALQLIAKARRLGFDLSVRDLFKAPRIIELASRIDSRKALPQGIPKIETSPAGPSREVAERLGRLFPALEAILPLTPLQQGILFHSLESKGAYQVQLQFRVEGNFDPDRFGAAWRQVIGRHQLLRMAVPEGESAWMVIVGRTELPWQFADWRKEPDPGKKLREYVRADREQGFDLGQAPLLRLGVFQVADQAWEVVINNHHITLDGWSLSIVLADVLRIYHGETLPPPLPFGRFADWLHARPMEKSLAWWKENLSGFDKPNRIDLPSSGVEKGFGEHTVTLSHEISGKLQQTARMLRTTPGILLQSVWGMLIARLSRDEDVVFGNVVAGRPAEIPGIEKMVGMFINTIPVRLKTEGRTLRQLVDELTTCQGEREEHETTPLHQIQAQAPIPRGMALFESLFVYENYPVDERLREERGLDFTIGDVRGNEAPHYPYSLAVLPGKEFTLQLTFDRRRCDLLNASALVRWFGNLLASALANPDAEIAELSLVDGAERRFVMEECNATAADYPRDKTLHRLFEEQAERVPGQIAVRCGADQLT
ncbi:MAG: hypothetical protein GX751_04305, partial [Desulfuromonadaceae bacterium]|nr:hypothetical protein [Desulfuromonadaceae bacterium]